MRPGVALVLALAAHGCGGAALSTDGGSATGDAGPSCPRAAGPLPAIEPAYAVIDDFVLPGALEGRFVDAVNNCGAYESFTAGSGSTFDPAPAVDPSCGAAAPGAAHVLGHTDSAGATFALSFVTTGDPLLPGCWASPSTGFTFRVALGDANASRRLTLRVTPLGSTDAYTKELTVSSQSWQTVTVPWGAFTAPPGAPALLLHLSEIAFVFDANADVDSYLDDLAFSQ
jgi:hypothetical protein